MKRIVIVGSGAHGRMTLDTLRALGTTSEILFVDDARDLWGTLVHGVKVVGGVEFLLAQELGDMRAVVAIGKPPLRAALAKRLADGGLHFVNVIHPSAIVSDRATLGVGNILGPQVVVEIDARVGNHCLANTGVLIAHDGAVGDAVNLSPGVLLGGRVTVGDEAFLGLGATVCPRLRIGKGAVVGAASLVTANVPDRTMVAGIPAKMVWAVNDRFDWSKLL